MADQPNPIELAARALRHHDRSRRQIADRLERAGIADERGTEALETLERLGYVNDERFALGRAAGLADRGYGDEGIRRLLEADGIDGELVERALAQLDPERERARRLIEQLGRSMRTAARLARKGFGEESVADAAEDVFADDGPEA